MGDDDGSAGSSDQERIWDYFQNEAPESFSGAVPRLRFLARKIRPPARVLNIGVGAGTFEEIAIGLGLDVHSLDPNEQSIASLRDRLKMQDRAKVGYAEQIPFPDGYFDAVVVSELLEHLTDSAVQDSLKEIARVLELGGRLLGTVPSRENLSEQDTVCPKCGHHFHRWGHVRSFDPNLMAKFLSAQFSVEEIVERPFIPWRKLNWKGRFEGGIKTLLHRLGIHGTDESIVWIAKKSYSTKSSS